MGNFEKCRSVFEGVVYLKIKFLYGPSSISEYKNASKTAIYLLWNLNS